MSVWAVIPIKPRAACKLRLRPALSDELRLRLVRGMLGHVIEAAGLAKGIDAVVLLSNERDDVPDRVPLISDHGADLNGALRGALPELARWGANAFVILPADLPTLTAADIDRLAEVARSGGVAIAPDWRDEGTNALAAPTTLRPEFLFGINSFQAHLVMIRRLGIEPAIVRSPGLAHDLDEPSDLRLAAGLFDPPITPARQFAALEA